MSHRVNSFNDLSAAAPEYEARSIESALDLLSITAQTSAPGSPSTEKLDRHPERRVKAAYAAYEDKYLPQLKDENPGLRLSQLKERLFKQWQKAPENPMNQVAGRYDMTPEEERSLAQAHREARLESMRVDPERLQRRLMDPTPITGSGAGSSSGERRPKGAASKKAAGAAADGASSSSDDEDDRASTTSSSAASAAAGPSSAGTAASAAPEAAASTPASEP